MYEQEFERLLEQQIRMANGQRQEALRRDKTGEKMLFCEVLRPVLPSSEWILEYEITSHTGVRIYLDFFEPNLRWGVECEGFVPHAEKITRDRFDFERVRIRTMAAYRIEFIPFTWDELRNKPEMCRRYLYGLLGRQTVIPGSAYEELSIYEREVIRYALYLNRPFRLKDVCYCVQVGENAARRVLRNMIAKNIIKTTGKGHIRFHEFVLDEKARAYLF